MDYLVCENCEGRYEIKSGESADDFISCQCGGNLKFVQSSDKPSITPKTKEQGSSNVKSYVSQFNANPVSNNPVNTNQVGSKPVKSNMVSNDPVNRNPSNFVSNEIVTDENNQNENYYKNSNYKHRTKNKIGRLNSKINLLGVFIGLLFSLIVLIILSLLSGILMAYGQLNTMGFIYLVLLSMMFIGGFFTSLLSCRTYSEGLTNGGFLGIITLVSFGFIIGSIWFSTMALMGSLANAFSGASSYNPTTSFTPTNTSFNDMLPLIEVLILPFLIILVAMAGGWFGVFIKKLLE